MKIKFLKESALQDPKRLGAASCPPVINLYDKEITDLEKWINEKPQNERATKVIVQQLDYVEKQLKNQYEEMQDFDEYWKARKKAVNDDLMYNIKQVYKLQARVKDSNK